jgi:fatty acid amide hydrolase
MTLTQAAAAASAISNNGTDELSDISACEIARRIAARELSAADAVEYFIARLDAVNGKLNAVTVDLYASARQKASEVDKAIARGDKLPPLAGLPVTIKECFDLTGTASTFGLTTRRDILETKDDPYVAALRGAGAIPIAKTNLPQLMFFTETENPLYGRTNNPWDLERSCGGSSGGEAAVIAARASPFGLGNDIGGSLRVPSAFCGITALRSTAGRFPDHCGHGLPTGQRAIVSQVGPMARYVEDVVMGLRVLEGARDPYIDPAPALGDPTTVDFSKLRFATFDDDGEFPASPAARRAVKEAVGFLSAAGATQVAWRKPDLTRATDFLFAVLSGDRAQTLRRLLRGNRVDRRLRPLLLVAGMPAWLRGAAATLLGALGQPRTARNARRFASGAADTYWQTVEAMAGFRAEMLQSLDQTDGGPIDLLLCPAYALPAVRHGATEMMPMPGAYVPLVNVTGFPGGVVPVTRVRPDEESDRAPNRDLMDRVARESERGSAGLPIAVQVIARPWREHVALAAMAAIEAAARGQPDYPARPPL